MPLCARCTGIYAGCLFAGTFLLVMRRLQRGGPPPAWITCLSMAFFAAMAADVFSSFLGWRQTNNTFRLATGALVGSTLPVLGWPLCRSAIWEKSKKERIIKTWEFLLLAGGILALVLLVECHSCPLLGVFSIISVLGLLLFLVGINVFALVALGGTKRISVFVLLSLLLSAGEVAFLESLHRWLLRWQSSG